MQYLTLVFIAATWAVMHSLMMGYSGLNAKRDAIVTGEIQGRPISLAYRRHIFTNDWLPLKFGLGLMALIFTGVIAAIPLLVAEEQREPLLWALAIGVALYPLYGAYGWLVRGLYDYQFIKDTLKALEENDEGGMA